MSQAKVRQISEDEAREKIQPFLDEFDSRISSFRKEEPVEKQSEGREGLVPKKVTIQGPTGPYQAVRWVKPGEESPGEGRQKPQQEIKPPEREPETEKGPRPGKPVVGFRATAFLKIPEELHSTFQSLLSQMPREHTRGLKVIKADPTLKDRDLLGEYKNQKIHLSPSLWEDLEDAEEAIRIGYGIPKKEKLPCSPVEFCLTHELGHHAFSAGVVSKPESKWQQVIDEMHARFKEAVSFESDQEPVTDYAKVNVKEHFAESYCTFKLLPNKLLKSNGQMFQFLRDEFFNGEEFRGVEKSFSPFDKALMRVSNSQGLGAAIWEDPETVRFLRERRKNEKSQSNNDSSSTD